MYSKGLLDNGLRVITSPMPHTRSVCVSIYIGAGSRYELDDQAGVSHFIEHLCFKGTERRHTAKEIAEAIDGVGGLLNAGTDKEFTVYWCKVARPQFPLALDLLSDMLRRSKFDASDIERERGVIMGELNECMDWPQDRVNRLIDEVLWPGQPLGREIIGTRETIGSMGREILLDYMGCQYAPLNTVVSVAGDIDHDEVLRSVGEVFHDWLSVEPHKPMPSSDSQTEPQLCVERRETEQAHLCIALRGLSGNHPDRFKLDLLNVILGAGMSSRLNQEIRERRGLAYDIHSYVEYFQDTGSIIIYAGVAPKQIRDTVSAVLTELIYLKTEIPESEVQKSKEMVKGRLLLGLEDSRSIAGWVGGQELLAGRILTVDEVVAIVDAITSEELVRLAGSLVSSDRLSAAIVGPVDDEDRIRSYLKL